MIGESAKHLDLDFVLSRIQVHTPYGDVEKRKLRTFEPSEVERLQEELNRVEAVVSLLANHRYTIIEIRNQFKRVRDLSGTLLRIEAEEVLSTTELFEVKTLTDVFGRISALQKALSWKSPEELTIQPLEELERLFDPERTGTGTFYIYDAYSDALKRIRDDIRTYEGRILSERRAMKTRLEEQLGLKLRPSGEITAAKTDKELIGNLEAVDELIYNSETYINVTFKIRSTPSMDACESHIELLKGNEEEEEYNVRSRLSRELRGWLDQLNSNIRAIGKLDVLLAKGALATGFQSVKPTLRSDGGLHISEGRHMRVAHALAKEDKPYTPISMDLRRGVTCITGANMGGKTVTLKLIGMLTAMAQMGLFVPAQEMSFTPRAWLFISVGDEQNSDQGLSTFGAEMLHIGRILHRADEDGLLLIDELARGTNPREGYAISRAILDYLKNRATQAVVTTHFDGLADAPEIKHLQVTGLSGVDFEVLRKELDEGGTVGIDAVHQLMDYRLREIHGPEEVPKDAINISRLMGLDEGILADARRILEEKE